MSINDQISNYEYETVLKKKMILVYFMSMMKHQNSGLKQFVDPSYKEKILRVSTKIESWYSKIENLKQTNFIDDNEFIIQGNSPSTFNSSSEEDESPL
jgi:hypothetical protein